MDTIKHSELTHSPTLNYWSLEISDNGIRDAVFRFADEIGYCNGIGMGRIHLKNPKSARCYVFVTFLPILCVLHTQRIRHIYDIYLLTYSSYYIALRWPGISVHERTQHRCILQATTNIL